MAKRFSDTEEWGQRWFLELSPESKNIWNYLKSNCDHAGIIKMDVGVIAMKIGYSKIDLKKFLQEVNKDYDKETGDLYQRKRVLRVCEGRKLWLTGYIAFQSGTGNNEVNESVAAVRGALNRLKAENLYEMAIEEGFIRVLKGSKGVSNPQGIGTGLGTGLGKDLKEKDGDAVPNECDRPVDEVVVEDKSFKEGGVGETNAAIIPSTRLEPVDERKSQYGGPTYGEVKEFFTQNTRSADEALNFWNEYEQKKWYVTNREGEPARKMKTGRDWQLKAEQWIIKARTSDTNREKNKPEFIKKIDNSTYKPAYQKPANNLCDCGCGRKAIMQVGDHPLRLYHVAERKCFEEKIKVWNKDNIASINDVLKQFNNQGEGIKT